MDFSQTLEQMLVAAKNAAGVHWKDIHAYLENELLIAKQEGAQLTLEVAHGVKTREQAAIEKDEIIDSLRDVENALHAGLKAAAQAAINAAISVLAGAVNKAVGFSLFP